ncbi:MAG: methyltransferase domain-containing protein [Kofleriaceae bacterium]
MNDISAAQQASWNRFSAGWKKWDDETMAFLAPHGAAIIEYLQPNGSDVVLDVAAGTGEPGLSMAKLVTSGKVVMADLAGDMLRVAKDKAAAAGVTNVEFREADVSKLPFPDASFDRVSCRMGFMFFPDMQLAANEMARVLKPGGKVATTVWSAPDKNFWVTAMVRGIGKHIEMTPPPPDAPGMFRCARPGTITQVFANAGLEDITETEVPCKLDCNGALGYWNMMTEVAAPFVAALSKADEATVARIKADVISAVDERYPGGVLDGCGTLIVARKRG